MQDLWIALGIVVLLIAASPFVARGMLRWLGIWNKD